MENAIEMPGLRPFRLRITHSILRTEPGADSASHIHDECEIYVNMSGKVSFMVENRLYPVGWGDIILSRPYEYHHCVSHSNQPHEHYWILFTASGNEALLRPFFDRSLGERNRVVLSPRGKAAFLQICGRLLQRQCGEELSSLRLFLDLLDLLNEGEAAAAPGLDAALPEELAGIVRYMHANFADALSIRGLAARFHCSVNTVERHFRRHLAVTPKGYLESIRLAHAKRCLAGGLPVQEAAARSGFSDCSRFIAVFKRQFGRTPLQFQKAYGYSEGKEDML